jgi:hypothetical protein
MKKLTDGQALAQIKKIWNSNAKISTARGVLKAGYSVFGNFRAVAEGTSWEEVIEKLPPKKTINLGKVSFPPLP